MHPEKAPTTIEGVGISVTAYRHGVASYGLQAPFHPPARFPEALFADVGDANEAYVAVRECLLLAGLDARRAGTSAWNPLAGLVTPGETVLVKPNLIKESHPRSQAEWPAVVTHGSVIRALCDYLWKALEGRGTVIVADAPQTDSSFSAIAERLGLGCLEAYYRERGLDFRLSDLRREEWLAEEDVIVRRKPLAGDPFGYIAFDLADASEFVGHAGAGRYYGADYDSAEVNRHHTGGRHEYLIAGTAIHADVVFNLPKLKTHKKAGITASLKNLVGINGDKNWLPHHTEGPRGDECPTPDWPHQLERSVARAVRRFATPNVPGGAWLHKRVRAAGLRRFGGSEVSVRNGNWWGNDTVWRMCLDLNKILLYGRPDASFRPERMEHRKRHYALVDGLIAGEGAGPLNPDPVAAGLLIFGTEPAWVDAVSATLMGFDASHIPIVDRAFTCERYPITFGDWRSIPVRSNVRNWATTLGEISHADTLKFKPHFGWVGHIEPVAVEA